MCPDWPFPAPGAESTAIEDPWQDAPKKRERVETEGRIPEQFPRWNVLLSRLHAEAKKRPMYSLAERQKKCSPGQKRERGNESRRQDTDLPPFSIEAPQVKDPSLIEKN